MANENCLAGMACPACGSEGPFRIAVTTTMEVDDDGSDPATCEGLEWEETSYCKCLECDAAKTVKEFQEGAKLWAATVTCRFCEKETPATTAHLHRGQWVGDTCCWDERLRMTE